MVDDVRFENEALALQHAGFVLVYLNTPWHVRFQRIRERTDDFQRTQRLATKILSLIDLGCNSIQLSVSLSVNFEVELVYHSV